MDKESQKMDYIMMHASTLQTRCEESLIKFLKQAGKSFDSLTDIPRSEIRHAQRGAFPDMRMIHLAPHLCDDFIKKPILKDLLCTRVGFQGPSPAHYIPRALGSSDYILIFCTDGKGWLHINGKEWEIDKYSAFLLPRHLPHLYGADPDNPWSNYWIHFQGFQAADFSSLIIPDLENPVIHLHNHQELTGHIEQLYQQMSHVHTYTALVAATGVLSQILGLIQMHMRSADHRPRTAHENIDRTIEFMKQNLEHRLTLKELANVAGMSVNHFGLLFSKRYQNSPIDYFNRLKIQRACELLNTTDLRISEVGESLGIQDPYYFSRLFKKVMGVSPRCYR